MNQAQQNMIRRAQQAAEKALRRIAELEARIEALEARRGPGRPRKDEQQQLQA